MHDSQGALRGRDAGRIWWDGSRAVVSASAQAERPPSPSALLAYLTRTDESVSRFQQEFQSGRALNQPHHEAPNQLQLFKNSTFVLRFPSDEACFGLILLTLLREHSRLLSASLSTATNNGVDFVP